MNAKRLTASILVLAAALAGCGGSPAAKSGGTGGHGPVDVLYAASLEQLFDSTLAPAFNKQSGDTFTGFAEGSDALASEIKGKVRQADVFISAAPAVNASLEGAANGDWVSWYASLASAPLVLGYNPHSRFVSQIRSRPWYDVVDLPGFRVGRTDPATDPKGKLTVTALKDAESSQGAAGLASILSSTSTVFPEQSLVGELQSGQLDAGFFYSNEAKAAGIPTVPLAPISLAASFTATVVNRAPHPGPAAAFVAFLYSAQGRKILSGSGLVLASPPKVSGSTAAVPSAVRAGLNLKQ